MSRYTLGNKRVEIFHFDCQINNEAHDVKHDTLALVTELILPAFLDANQRRVDSNATYLFVNARIVILPDESLFAGSSEIDKSVPIICIAGQFVKKTQLTRRKVFNETRRELVQDEQSMENSQDAFFILVLNNCRLVYVSEMAASPNIGSFRATINHFLLSRHKVLVENISANHKAQIRLAKKRVETVERSLRNVQKRIASASQATMNSYQQAESRLNQELRSAVAEFEQAMALPARISQIELLFSKPYLRITDIRNLELLKGSAADVDRLRTIGTSIGDTFSTIDTTRLPRQWQEDWLLYSHYALTIGDEASADFCHEDTVTEKTLDDQE